MVLKCRYHCVTIPISFHNIRYLKASWANIDRATVKVHNLFLSLALGDIYRDDRDWYSGDGGFKRRFKIKCYQNCLNGCKQQHKAGQITTSEDYEACMNDCDIRKYLNPKCSRYILNGYVYEGGILVGEYRDW